MIHLSLWNEIIISRDYLEYNYPHRKHKHIWKDAEKIFLCSILMANNTFSTRGFQSEDLNDHFYYMSQLTNLYEWNKILSINAQL